MLVKSSLINVCSEAAQRQKPIDFATKASAVAQPNGLRLAHCVDRNCGIREIVCQQMQFFKAPKMF